VMAGRMIETFFIGNDANVGETAEKNQGSELKLLFLWRRSKCCPIGSRRATVKIEAGFLKRAPDKT